jgi:hypothetical protein
MLARSPINISPDAAQLLGLQIYLQNHLCTFLHD